MGQVLKLIENFKKLDIDKVSSDAMNEKKQFVADAQREQLKQGISSVGGTLRKYRSAAYARKKNAMNPLPGLGNPDLKLTGNFYKGITATVEGGKIVIKSSDEKAQELEAKYDEDLIFGLYPEEKAQFIKDHLRPAFNRNIKNEVGL